MKTNKLTGLLAGFLFALGANAQFFSDDFSVPSNWSTAGSTTICCGWSGGSGTMQINNNQLELRDFRGSQTFRYQQSIGQVLNANDVWRMEFELTPVTINNDNAAIFALTDNTDHWYSNSAGSTTRNNTSSIHVAYVDPLGSNQEVKLHIRDKYQNVWGPPSDRIRVYAGTTYYVRAERISAGEVILSVYSDPARTVHVTGSPVCHDVDSRIAGLQYFQASTNTIASQYRIADVNLDDVEIFDNTIESCGIDCDVTASMDIKRDEKSCQYIFTNTSSVGNGNTFMGSVINFGDNSYQEVGLNGSVNHSYNPQGPYQPCITTFSYIFDGENYICCSDKQCYDDEFDECYDGDESIPIGEPETCEINAAFDYSVGCNGMVNFFDASFFGSGHHLTTVVDFGDGTPPIEIGLGDNFQHTFPGNGVYEVCITIFGYYLNGDGQFECCREELCINVVITNFDEPCDLPGGFRLKSTTNEASFSVSPNPVSDNLTVNVKEGTNRIKILNLEGKLIREYTIANELQTVLDVKELPNGVYIISVEDGQTIENQKIIKQ